MKLFEAIIYVNAHKDNPLPILKNDFTNYAVFGDAALNSYKEFNSAMTAIMRYKILYFILKCIKVI